ncbi:MAG: hypothetical protein JXR96_15165 [Deltaproteobacteria bacterium]|nr:hypothetical protein [Deltaproteobacteria bacterium]
MVELEKKRSRLVVALSLVNLAILGVNLVGGWIRFFTFGARPDGVEPALHLWLGVIWLLGPLLALCSLVVAAVSRRSMRMVWANAGVLAAYAIIWGAVLAL